jgi:hypothetical protein
VAVAEPSRTTTNETRTETKDAAANRAGLASQSLSLGVSQMRPAPPRGPGIFTGQVKRDTPFSHDVDDVRSVPGTTHRPRKRP